MSLDHTTPDAASAAGQASAPVGDLSALAWVHDELRRTLEGAQKILRRALRESTSRAASLSPGADGQAPLMLQARGQLHQVVGALEMIGLPAAARFVHGYEVAVQRLTQTPNSFDTDALAILERAGYVVMDYLRRQLAGQDISPLALFPSYQEMMALAGVQRAHPADLCSVVVSSPEPGELAATATPLQAGVDARAIMERELLASLRGRNGTAPLQRMSDLCASLAAGTQGRLAEVWHLASAFFEAQATGRLAADDFSRRMASRLLAQLRASERGVNDTPDTLIQDLRFFCARASAQGQGAATRLTQVRRALSLPELAALDYANSPLGRFDPALLPLAKRRVAAFRESWSALASGDASTAGQVNEQAALVAESVRQLYPDGEQLAQALRAAVASPSRPEGGPRPEVAMEVATALLCVDSSLDEMDLDEPQLGQRVKRLAVRLDQVASGKEPPPIEPWMESLYREVSDRQTMGSVVQELRASLAEVEQQLDRFHRQPQDRDPLFMVPGQLASMRGVLSVLGLDHAAQAVQRMREDVDRIAASPEHQASIDARLADNLGGLSFLIDMLAVQPQLAKSLFRFDAETGCFTALMGRATVATPVASAAMDPALQASLASVAEEALWGQTTHDDLARSLEGVAQQAMAADAPALAQAMTRAHEALADAHEGAGKEAARASIAEAIGQIATVQSAAPASMAPSAPLVDADMRDVFIEEAREVLSLARESLETLSHQPRDLGAMTSLRRTFHTLKGSARMVGLADVGEAAWAYEQLLNARLAEAVIEADAVMREFAARAVANLSAWVDAVARSPQAVWDASALIAEAHLLRDTAGQVSDEARAAPQPPVLTSPVDEDLAEDEVTHYAELDIGPAPAAPALTVLPSTVLELDLDLSHGEPEPVPITAPQALDQVSDTHPGALDAEPATITADDASPEAVDVVEAGVDVELDFAAAEPDQLLELVDVEPASAPSVHVPPTLTLVETPAPQALEPEAVQPLPEDDADRFKMVGHLRVPIGLFNVFLNEADEQSRRLCVELAEWSLEHHQALTESSEALAHSLAGNSATVGYSDLSALARRLEHALERSRTRGQGSDAEAKLFVDVGDEIRRLLHQFAAGFLRAASPELLQRLDEHEAHEAKLPHAVAPAAAPVAPTIALGEMRYVALSDEPDDLEPHTPEPSAAHAEPAGLAALGDVLESQDDLDPVLWPVFAEEGEELLPALAQELRHWEAAPSERTAPLAAMRALHTFKGGARLAGAMALGELAHRLESSFEHVLAHLPASAESLSALAGGVDRLDEHFQHLLTRAAGPAPIPPSVQAELRTEPDPAQPLVVAPAAPAPVPEAASAPAVAAVALAVTTTAQAAPDWSRFLGEEALRGHETLAGQRAEPAATVGTVRVRVPLLDRMVSHAGEVSAARARIDSELGQMRQGLKELTENLDRLRRQLRDLEIQAETQMASRMEAARAAQQTFDPLEMDRFTRVQELTRMLAESVNDVGTVQRTLQQSIQVAEDQLAQQARLARDLQDDLLRARMVEFDTLSERLYRVVRQAAKETGKQVRLNLAGGTTEVDRGVLDRMAPAFEHLLRNAVVHGIEPTTLREATGKDPVGTIDLRLRQVGNEVQIEVRDDGAGLDLVRIAERARRTGVLTSDAKPTEAELAGMIFRSGFTTSEEVTELAGRGVGMDVVRAEVTSLGGRIDTASATGRGTAFQLVLPLTTAVTQVVVLNCDDLVVAVSSNLVERVMRTPVQEVEAAYRDGVMRIGEDTLPFFWMGGLLEHGGRGALEGKTASIVVARSASQRVALHVGQVLGNQEVVVKNLGPQLARLPALSGLSMLPDGQTVLIYNPVALAAIYGAQARDRMRQSDAMTVEAAAAEGREMAMPLATLVMVVDDSLTVRRVTQRLLQREGYRVQLAKDGLEALELLGSEKPAVVLSDIEMPRMDGFDLLRNLRADARLRDLPVVMITSRIAQRHHDLAMTLGANEYLGKPYDEQALLNLVRGFVDAAHGVGNQGLTESGADARNH